MAADSKEEEALKRVFSCIDNTSLHGDDTQRGITDFCSATLHMADAAKRIGPVAAVCVYPVFVGTAHRVLKGSGIKVVSVAGAFPTGFSPLAVKKIEVQYALDEGADEIDMVLNRGLFLGGSRQEAYDEVAAIKEVCANKTLKVILETGELRTIENITLASCLAMEAGADFIKTSTGKMSVGATVEAAKAMLHATADFAKKTGKKVGFKAAGGITKPEEALKYYYLAQETWKAEKITYQTFRIGASQLTENLFSILTKKS